MTYRSQQERVEECIQRVISQYPGDRPAELAKYFEAVHQELAPLARDLERQRDELLSALKLVEPSLDFSCWESADGEPIGEKINAAIAIAKGGTK